MNEIIHAKEETLRVVRNLRELIAQLTQGKAALTDIRLKQGQIPVRVLKICSGDLGDLKYEQVDIEAYSPRKNQYFEVGSCSNLTTCQARKLGISTTIKGQRLVPHTLNNTALASSRALVALIENNQQKDGSIKIPKVLHKYTGFKEIKKPVKK